MISSKFLPHQPPSSDRLLSSISVARARAFFSAAFPFFPRHIRYITYIMSIERNTDDPVLLMHDAMDSISVGAHITVSTGVRSDGARCDGPSLDEAAMAELVPGPVGGATDDMDSFDIGANITVRSEPRTDASTVLHYGQSDEVMRLEALAATRNRSVDASTVGECQSSEGGLQPIVAPPTVLGGSVGAGDEIVAYRSRANVPERPEVGMDAPTVPATIPSIRRRRLVIPLIIVEDVDAVRDSRRHKNPQRYRSAPPSPSIIGSSATNPKDSLAPTLAHRPRSPGGTNDIHLDAEALATLGDSDDTTTTESTEEDLPEDEPPLDAAAIATPSSDAPPRTLTAIVVPPELHQTVSGQDFLQADIDYAMDQYRLFTTADALRSLARANSWLTLETLSTKITLLQVLIILGIHHDGHIQPHVYVLMARKVAQSYDHIVQALIGVAAEHSVALRPAFVQTNFNYGEMFALSAGFPGLLTLNYVHHIAVSLHQAVKVSGLEHKYVLDKRFAQQHNQLVALAYLPHAEIPAAFFLIKPHFAAESQPLLEWFQQSYIVGKKRPRDQHQRFAAPLPPRLWSLHDMGFDAVLASAHMVATMQYTVDRSVCAAPGVRAIVEEFRAQEHLHRRDGTHATASAPPANVYGLSVANVDNYFVRCANVRRLVANRANLPTEMYLLGIAGNLGFCYSEMLP